MLTSGKVWHCRPATQWKKSGNQISNLISKSGSFEQQSNLFYYTVLKHGLSPQNNNTGWMDAKSTPATCSKSVLEEPPNS